ncbi:MAG: BspA family leucine-rich repeat surface protein [Erysipelotrichaceae bacterium]
MIKLKKKGFIAIEVVLIGAFVLLFSAVTVPKFLDSEKKVYDVTTNSQDQYVYKEVDGLDGITIDTSSGKSIYPNTTGDDTIILPPTETGPGDLDDGKAHVQEVKLTPKSMILNIGESNTIDVELVPTIPNMNINNKGITWSSDNPNVAKVTQNGVVTAIGAGETIISVRTHDNNKEDFVTVLVNPISASEIITNVDSLKLRSGNNFQIVASILPVDATDQTVSYFVEDETIATISPTGLVTAGKPTIDNYRTNIILRNGLLTKIIPLEVEGDINVTTDILLNPNSLVVEVGQMKKINATIHPTDATVKGLSYVSADEYFASVSNDGVVTGQNVGLTYINVCNKGASFFGDEVCRSVAVNITKPSRPIMSMSLTYNASQINSGDSLEPTLTYTPFNATNKGVLWSTSDEKIVQVNSNGVITGVQNGTATITATAMFNPSIKATYTIETTGYRIKVSSLEISNGDLTMTPGETTQLNTVILPADASDKSLSYKTSNSAVASVSDTGRIIAITPGTTIITAKSISDGLEASIIVTVNAIPVTKVEVTPKLIELGLNETKQINVKVTPTNATYQDLEYRITDIGIASISNGIITGVSYGKTSMSVTTPEGISDTIAIDVREIKAERIVANPKEVTIVMNQTAQLSAQVFPDTTVNKNYAFNIVKNETMIDSNGTIVPASVVSMNASGVVTGLNPGDATINVVSESDLSVKDEITVHVTPLLATSVQILSPNPLTLKEVGTQARVRAQVMPLDTVNQNLIYRSKDTNIVSVAKDAETNVVLAEAKGVGETDVEIIAADSVKLDAEGNPLPSETEVKAILHVIVTTDYIKATSLTTTDPLDQLMLIGENKTLPYTVGPADASDKTVSWTSSDDSIATVSPSGNVVAIGKGIVYITATHKDGLQLTFTIEVKGKDISKFIVAPSEIILQEIGDTATYTIDTDANVTDLDYTVVTSSGTINEGIIKIDKATKTITGLKKGNVFITFEVPEISADVLPENLQRVISVTVLDASNLWDGTSVEKPEIINNSCLIKTAKNLAWVSKTSQSEALGCSTLDFKNDIDLNKHDLRSIADAKDGIELNIKGNDFTISNGSFTSQGSNNGLISKLLGKTSVLSDLKINGITLKNSANTKNAGLLVGMMDNGHVENVEVQASVVDNTALNDASSIGYVIGTIEGLNKTKNSIMNVSSQYNSISVDSVKKPAAFGGLIGTINKPDVLIAGTTTYLNSGYDGRSSGVKSGEYIGSVASNDLEIANFRAISEELKNKSLIGYSSNTSNISLANYYLAMPFNQMETTTPVILTTGDLASITSKYGYYSDTNRDRLTTPTIGVTSGLDVKTDEEMFSTQTFVDTLNTATGYPGWIFVEGDYPRLGEKVGLTEIKLNTRELVVFMNLSKDVPVDVTYQTIPLGMTGKTLTYSSLDTNILQVDTVNNIAHAGNTAGTTKIHVTVDNRLSDDMNVTSFEVTESFGASRPLTPAIEKALIRDAKAGLIEYQLPTPTTWIARTMRTEISKEKFQAFVPAATATSVKFLKGNVAPAGYTSKTDLSALGIGSITGYALPNNCYEIISERTIGAPMNSSNFFENHSVLKILEFNNFDTSNVTDMRYMFISCSGLTTLDVSNFNTSNVINTSGMFGDCSSLVSLNVSSLDTSNVVDMSYIFFGCSSLTSLSLSNFNTSNVTTMDGMFGSCSSLTILNLSNFNTANVTNMMNMFRECSNLTTLDVSNFNTSKVTDMNWMFGSCSNLTSLNLSSFNTSNVTNMDSMFYFCANLTSLNLSNFDTSNVTSMETMFGYCLNLTSLNLSNFNVLNVTNMSGTFTTCNKLTTEINIENTSVANISLTYMFGGTSSIPPAKTVVNYTTATSKVVDDMIATKNPGDNVVKGRNLDWVKATSITSTDALTQSLTVGNTKQLNATVNPVNTDKTVTWSSSNDAVATVSQSGNVVGVTQGAAVITVRSVDGPSLSFTVNVIKEKNEISKSLFNQFVPAASATSVKFLKSNVESAGYTSKTDLSTLQDGSITGYALPNNCYEIRSIGVIMAPVDSNSFFKGSSTLNMLEFKNFNTSNVINMASVFEDCSNLTFLDVSNFNTLNAINMSNMFNSCESLTSLDISKFDTSKVTDMSYMFYDCNKLTSLNVSNFNTINTTNMQGIFNCCSSLTTLNLSNFNTSHVKNMAGMFNRCYNLTSLSISNFNTSNVTDMNGMFYACRSLTSLNLSSFDTSYVVNMRWMFAGCSSLASLKLPNLNLSNAEDMMYMFDACKNLTTEINVLGTTTNVKSVFSIFGQQEGASSIPPAKTILNYTTTTSDLVDTMIRAIQWVRDANVVKGRKLY